MKGFLGEAFGLACGILRWPPQDFWAATPMELQAAWEAFCRFHGLQDVQGLGPQDYEELKQRLNTSGPK